MKTSIKILLAILLTIILFIIGIYLYVQIRFNIAFEEYGMQYTCCPCPGKEMFDVCCDCKVPETFLEKIQYLSELKSRR